MSRAMDDLVQMAREAWLSDYGAASLAHHEEVAVTLEDLDRFAQLVAKKAVETEREACARVCDALGEDMTIMAQWGTTECAVAIRARASD